MPSITLDSTPLAYRDHGGGVRKTTDLPVVVAPGTGQFADSLVIPFVDAQGDILVTRTVGGTDRYMWEESDTDNSGDPRPQTLSVDQVNQLFGSECLQTVTTDGGSGPGAMFTRFLSNKGDASNDIKYLREILADAEFGTPQVWSAFNHYNRLRFWYQPPPQILQSDPIGSTNFHVGTYLRALDGNTNSQETDNWHFYHYYNIPYLGGNWAQVLVDSHPSHQRGGRGANEQYNKTPANLDPANSAGRNYFDLLTQFYVTERNGHSSYPATCRIDGFEVYHDPNLDEDLDHIYSVWAGLHAGTDEIKLGWKRDKTQDDKTFDVKYAFSSFWDNGGFAAHGNDAPGGQNLDPPNFAGYNGLEYSAVTGGSGAAIDVSGQDAVYLAVRHQDESTRFREIRVPLTAAGVPGIGA